MLLNLFTHSLQQVLFLTGGSVSSATGWARPATDPVPVGPLLHDFRQWAPLSPEEVVGCEWRTPDADMSAAVLASLTSANGRFLSMSWHGSAATLGRHDECLTVFGTEGTLHLIGQPWVQQIEYGTRGSGSWEVIPVPNLEKSASVEDPIQDGWNQLVRDFVDDIRVPGSAGYPTFVDGWIANEVIDSARRRSGWTSLPDPLT